jgi:hypothetical protein
VFAQFGHFGTLRAAYGNVCSADGWDGVSPPIVAHCRGNVSRIYFREALFMTASRSAISSTTTPRLSRPTPSSWVASAIRTPPHAMSSTVNGTIQPKSTRAGSMVSGRALSVCLKSS